MRVGHREDDDIDIVERGLLVDARDPEFVLQTGPAGLAQLDVANVIFARLQIPRQACAHLSTRSEEHTSELQSLMRISYAVFCFKKKNIMHKSTAVICQINTHNKHQDQTHQK